MTRVVRPFILLFILAAILGMTAWTATPAAAASVVAIPTGRDCLAPPYPSSPSSGFAAWIDPGPDKPAAGDPFDPQSGTTVYDVYGYAGLEAVMFDRGGSDVCSPFAWDPPNALANGLMNTGAALTAVSVRFTRIVMSGNVGSIWDPVQAETSKILGTGLFIPLVGVAGALSGVYIMAQHKAGKLAAQAKSTLGVILIVSAGVASLSFTVSVGGSVDRMITEAFGAANDLASGKDDGTEPRDRADQIAANLVGNVLYQTWASETFGSDSAAAQEYGPRLFAAGAFTREEQRSITPTTEEERRVAGELAESSPLDQARARQAGTDQGAKAIKLVEDKQNEYKKLAKEIETKYPQAYQQLAGRDTNSRLQYSFAGLIAAGAATVFLIYCLVRMAWAMIVVRVGLGATPVVALIAQFPRAQHLAMSLLMWVVEAVGKAVVFGFGFVVFLAGGIGGIMSPELVWHPMVKAGALIAMSVAFWKLAQRLGMQGNVKWKMPRFRDDDHQYGKRWPQEKDETTPPSPLAPQGGGSPQRGSLTTGPPLEATQRARSAIGSAPFTSSAATGGQPGVTHLGSLPSTAARTTIRGTATRVTGNLAAIPTGGTTRLALTAAAATAKPGVGSTVRGEVTRRADKTLPIRSGSVFRPGNEVQSVMTAPARAGKVHNVTTLPKQGRAATATVYKPPRK